jgi:hypothetical protein
MFGMLEALLSFFRRQVGLRTDSASSSGSLHAKAADIKSYLTSKVNNIPGDVWGHGSRSPSATVAGNTVRLSANVERSSGSGAINKQIKVNVTGMVRAKFELKGKGTATLAYLLDAPGTIYTVNVNNYSTYTSYSKDFPVCAGDVISLYATPGGDESIYLRNFQLCWEYSSAPVTGRVLVD